MNAAFQDEIQLPDAKPAEQSQQDVYLANDLAQSARNNFIKKVYMILTLQLMITFGMSLYTVNVPSFYLFQTEYPSLMWISFAVLLVVEILIICTPLGKSFPSNMALLLIFTLCESYSVSFICGKIAKENGPEVVFTASIITLGIVCVLTGYAFYTKSDFSIGVGIMLTVLTAMLIFTYIAFITNISFFNNAICALGAILFGIYIIIDTQMIIGGGKYEISMDDYIFAALILYIDIIQMFLYILKLLSRD